MNFRIIQPLKFRTTRWMQFIFPKELIIDQTHCLTKKRHFPAFWIIKEESIPLSKVASIQITRGLLFSSIVIENSGGPFPITIKGIPNKKATRVRQILETYDQIFKKPDIQTADEDAKTCESEKKTKGIFSLLTNIAKPDSKRDKREFEDEDPIEIWWNEPEEWEKEDIDPSIPPKKSKFNEESYTKSPTGKHDSMLDTYRNENQGESSQPSSWIKDIVKKPSKRGKT